MKSKLWFGGVEFLLLSVVLTLSLGSLRPVAAGDAPGMAQLKSSILQDVDVDGKVVYVDFWASWCAPCKKSFPWMQAMHEEFAERGLLIVAVNLDEDRHQADKFLERANPDFLISFEKSEELAEAFDLQAMPTSLIFGRDGTLVARHEGFESRHAGILSGEIETALAVEPPAPAH